MNGQENRIVNLKHKGMVMKAKYYRHRHNRWVVVLWWNGKQHRRFHYDDRTPLETEALARRIAERINGDIEDKGKNFDPRQWFRSAGDEFYFETYAEKWLDRQSHLAPSYAKDVKRFVNKHWVPFFGKKDIRQIRAGDIQDFRHWLPNHLSEKTKKNIVDALHVLFVDAHNREDILRIPPFPTIRFQESEIRWITEEWQDRIIGAIPEPDRPIFRFVRFYGVRPGEARALMWDCVDFENEMIIIRRTFSDTVLRKVTKARNIKYLPMMPEMKALLWPIRGLGGFVFRNRHGRPYSGKIRLIWNKARDQVGAPKVTLYQGTRHSLGTQLLDEDNPLETVQKLLGHKRPDMTLRYAKVRNRAVKRMLENRDKKGNHHQTINKES